MNFILEVRSSTTLARQLHELNVQNRHIHLIGINYCKDTRPGAQLEASQQQHNELCKQLQSSGETLASLLVRETFLNAHGLLASVDFTFLYKVLTSPSMKSSWVWAGLPMLPIPWIKKRD
eukprot:1156673-Pelagomonas_calceolata.AAC.3